MLRPDRGSESEQSREAHKQLMFEQRDEHLRNLTAEVLRDIARNDSAPHEWRKAAVEMLIEKHAPYINHPDLAPLLAEITTAEADARKVARNEVESIVESAIESPLGEPEEPETAVTTEGPFAKTAGPFRASFTTKSFQDDAIDN